MGGATRLGGLFRCLPRSNTTTMRALTKTTRSFRAMDKLFHSDVAFWFGLATNRKGHSYSLLHYLLIRKRCVERTVKPNPISKSPSLVNKSDVKENVLIEQSKSESIIRTLLSTLTHETPIFFLFFPVSDIISAT